MNMKRDYMKPSMKVVELKQCSMLLAGSKLDSLDNFTDGGDPLNPSASNMDDEYDILIP